MLCMLQPRAEQEISLDEKKHCVDVSALGSVFADVMVICVCVCVSRLTGLKMHHH